LAVRRAVLETAVACQPRDSPECSRYLVGVLNVPGAHASVTKGVRKVMASMNTTEAQHLAADGEGAEMNAPQTSGVGAPQQPPQPIAGEAAVAASRDPQAVAGIPQVAVPAHVPGHETFTVPAVQSSGTEPVPALKPSVATSSADCGCNNAQSSYVFAIGTIGFDFGTEARRDTFRQLMPRPLSGDPTVSMPVNPYDVIQLSSYLADYPSESTKVIWTLDLDATPIYAVEAECAYPEEVYGVLRSALRNQNRPSADQNYVSRVSIPGTLTTQTRRLFSGQVVPLVKAQPRGLSTWNETALIDAVMAPVMAQQPDNDETNIRLLVRNFLDKIYFQLRNLGQSAQDRALNYAATNAFTFASGAVLQQALLSAQKLPGPNNLYTLDTISVAKSPYCRPGSICFDVQVTFFDPENDRRARSVYQYTVDVSDEMPVSLAPTHQFFIAG
jgi:cyanobactin maturation PatA/PatG family protease